MKNQTEILKEYATEDLNLLIENGSFAMTETAYNCVIWFTYENKVFTAAKNDGTVMIETNKKALIRSFIQNCFQTI